jgi:5-methyltetrahydrofolate--homocysteine methyltransferase
MEILKHISLSLQAGDDKMVAHQVRQAIEEELPTTEILDNGLIAGMAVVGDRFRRQEVFLPEVLLAARAMNAGMELLKPLLIAGDVPTRAKVVLGSIEGDLHDLGKNLVGIMLKGAGFEVIDLGIDVPPAKFVDTAEAEDASVIGISALLTTTMTRMGKVVELRNERGLSDKISVIVGGAPLSHEFARAIGASAYCYDAANAVEVVTDLTGGA